jgi:hypothetical protein
LAAASKLVSPALDALIAAAPMVTDWTAINTTVAEKAKKSQSKLSAAVKKLARVNTKGRKNLSPFFMKK